LPPICILESVVDGLVIKSYMEQGKGQHNQCQDIEVKVMGV